MMEKSSERLREAVATSWPESALLDLDFLVTIGFDSSSVHVNPQQKFNDEQNEELNPHQSLLLVTSMLIIHLKSRSQNEYKWINPIPQSYRFCPIKKRMTKLFLKNITVCKIKSIVLYVTNLL